MQQAHTNARKGQLGTFAGVFTPSILTILGIILFLRLGYVVGRAGLFQALVIIAVANLISVLTSFSLAAIATNMKVKGGGDYYMISRTLGLEFGGALGLVLFLAQSVSIAFYCIGFGESVTAITGGAMPAQVVAASAVAFLFVLAWVGADLATTFQYAVMAFVVLALGSFYAGGISGWKTQTLIRNWASPGSWSGFWILFALFFPAVTFAKGSGKNNNPRRAVLLCLCIAMVTIMLGQLNLIAGIVSMFFLISYGLLNYATYFEASTDSPSFRPRFKLYDKRISLLGALGCLVVMLAIDLRTGIAAAGVLFAIYQYLKRHSGPSRWADSRRSHHLRAVRENLLAAQEDLAHPREWRPVILAVTGKDEGMGTMIGFARLIEGNSGITTLVRIIRAEGYKTARLKKQAYEALNMAIQEQGGRVFPLAVTVSDPVGLPVLFQSSGIGPVKANTLLAEWDPARSDQDLFMLKTALRNQCNVVLLDHKPWADESEDPESSKEIHVWWKGDDASRLMILLAYLITRNAPWEPARIRLMAFDTGRDQPQNLEQINEMLDDIRIDADPRILGEPSVKQILEISGSADIVFLPVYFRESRLIIKEGVAAADLVAGLNQVAFVIAAHPMDLDTTPEEGDQAETARLLDGIHHAQQRVTDAEACLNEAIQVFETAAQALNLETAADPSSTDDIHPEIQADGDALRQAGEKVARERAKLKALTHEAMALGLPVSIDEE